MSLTASEYVQLRSEAISALSLVDIRATTKDSGWIAKNNPGFVLYLHSQDLYLNWDPPHGLLVRRAVDHKTVHRIQVEHAVDEENYVRISPDNRFVFSLDDNALLVWQVDGTRPKEILRLSNVAIVGFAPDRPEIVVVYASKHIAILPLDGGPGKSIPLSKIVKEPVVLEATVIGPRRQIACLGSKKILVVDLDLGHVTGTFAVPGRPDDMDWSTNGETLAVSNLDRGITLYHTCDQSLRIANAPLGGPADVSFDPSGRYLLVVGRWTGRNSVLDAARGVQELQFHTSELENPTLPTTRWGLTLDNIHRVITLQTEDGLAVFESLAVHPAGRLLATPTANGITLSDLWTGRRLGFLSAPGVCRVARFDSFGNLFAVRDDRPRVARVCRWEVKAIKNGYTVGAPTPLGEPGVAGIDVSADGRYVAAAMFDGSIVLDRQTGQSKGVDDRKFLRQVAIHPDGSLIASFAFDKPGFRVWDAKSKNFVLSHSTGNEGRGRFSPNGKYLITYGQGESDLLVWSMPECKLAQRLGTIGVFAISSDSQFVAVTEPSGKIRLNRIANGETIARFDAPGQDYLIDLAFSPDGRHLLGMNTERTRHHVWDLWKLRQQLRELKLDWESSPPPQDDASVKPISVQITPQAWWGPLIGQLCSPNE